MLRFNCGVKVSEVVRILKQVRDILSKNPKSTVRIKNLTLNPDNVCVSNSANSYLIKQTKTTFPNSKVKWLEFSLHKSCSKKEFVSFLDELIQFLSKYPSDYITFDFKEPTLNIYDIVNEKFLRKFVDFCKNRKNPVSIYLGFNSKPEFRFHPLWFKWSYNFLQENDMYVEDYRASYYAQSIWVSDGLHISFHFRGEIQLWLSKILELSKQKFEALFTFINTTIKRFLVDNISTEVEIKYFIDKQIMEYITQLLFVCYNAHYNRTLVEMNLEDIPKGNIDMQVLPMGLFEFVDQIQKSIVKHMIQKNADGFYMKCEMRKTA